ncbi:hypothetical protein AB0C93_01815 [Streptomyces sp. NPDC048518]|uniref:hypothetical protein n=1 Tax=Streptomyces sp. NPDC048518 TaxID=3155029 RepID=UPI0033D5CA91
MTLFVVAGAGWFFIGGGFAKWRDGPSLADACDGTVAVDQVRALLKTDDVTGKTKHTTLGRSSADESGPPVMCWLDGPRGFKQRAYVKMEWRSKAWGPNIDAGRRDGAYTRLSAPITGGWSGMMTHAGDQATAAVVLRCRNTTGPRVGDSLSLFATSWGGRPFKEAAQRVRLARFATQTARAAAREYGCDARFGSRVERIAPLEYGLEEYPDAPALARAGGTCAGVRAGWLITRAQGTATAEAPVEDCLLLDDHGRIRFRLSAYYGTFADDQRLKTRSTKSLREYSDTSPLRTDFVYRAEATCPGSPRQAVFVIDYRARSDSDDDKPQRRYARAALEDFAERSAARHGCTDTKLL